jgi:hypothetical protein
MDRAAGKCPLALFFLPGLGFMVFGIIEIPTKAVGFVEYTASNVSMRNPTY